MRLEVKPEGVLESAAFLSGKLPKPMVLAMLGIGVSQALIAAVRLNVFAQLRPGPQSVGELAQTIGGDRHGLQVLLEALHGFGFLKRQGERYRLTGEAQRWLTDEGDTFALAMIRLCGDINQQLDLLEADIRTGRVPNFHFDPQSPTCLSNYQDMLKGSGHRSAPRLIEWAKLDPPPDRLLDVAGGPAQYSIAFCKQFVRLRADILDLPYAARAGEKQVAEAGLSERIRYIEGNLLETDWPVGYDVALLSHILHCLSEAQCELTLRKSFAALISGGRILVQDVYHPGAAGSPGAGDGLMSLVYYATCGGRSWPESTIRSWLKRAGFIRVRSVRKVQALLVSGEKP
ncbi:methyltransferase [Gloeobacter morelensis]|uniref:Methyltransferase type 12 n=1 Tax=Gloeobacter morelensis MG652769 TaxID=2781736 RepID=A0ABY3PME7_9CYAN|nr:methyltransferase [Gloeobacter morelensis]UFP94758.1 methyltransferase type 12 [Gloeobacter morelensis MG652769]